jgi:hypothetical protein
MTQEEKDLLLKDLCARLPYGVKFQSENIETALFVDTSDDEVWINGTCIDDFKPYLFPLSSMTEEEERELNGLLSEVYDFSFRMEELLEDIQMQNGIPFHYIDWFNKNHFDYRRLIEKGLANDATGLNIY